MLEHLSVKNYAIIDNLELELGGNLSIITGETGAGKSILLGALSLILGQRADHNTLRDRDAKCIVEGTFRIKDLHLKPFFATHDLDYEDQTIIRREISPQGKSRAFINDTPVNLSVLRELSSGLVNLHAQHEVLDLFSDSFQLEAIDALAGHTSLLEDYKQHFLAWNKARSELDELLEQSREAAKDMDYNQFQYDELNRANLQEGEQEKMEKEIKVQENVADIKHATEEAYGILGGKEGSITEQLQRVSSIITKLSEIEPAAVSVAERLKSVLIELQDLSSEVERLDQDIEVDPAKAELYREKLDLIYTLQHKHGVYSTTELLAILEDLATKVNSTDELADRIDQLQQETAQQMATLMPLAEQISSSRASVLAHFEEQVSSLLSDVGMVHATLKVEQITDLEDLKPSGPDSVRFLFSSNKGSDYQPLKRVASGGELSRLMLCIKSIIANRSTMPTLIFDEIDTGISGEIAGKVGQLIAGLAGGHQVLCITHRPQIASKGNAHYYVYKEVEGEETHTRIQQLSDEDRVREIAKMLSGEQPSDAALANARELLLN